MTTINDMVLTELIGISIRPAGDHEVGPNAKVESPGVGLPKVKEEPNATKDPDFYKNFPGDKLPAEKADLNVPANLATGSEAGESLRKAVQSHQKSNK